MATGGKCRRQSRTASDPAAAVAVAAAASLPHNLFIDGEGRLSSCGKWAMGPIGNGPRDHHRVDKLKE